MPCLSRAADQKVTVIEPWAETISLNGRMEALRDPSGKLTIDDVTKPDLSARFKPVQGRFTGGFTRDTVWLRFTVVKKNPKADDEWWLEIYPPFLDEATFYEPAFQDRPEGKPHFREGRAGRLLPLSARDMAERNLMFIVHSVDNRPETCYLRVRTTGTMFVDARLWDSHAFTRSSGRVSALLGGFYGILVLLLALNLVFWFVLKDRLFIIYSFFLLSLAVIFLQSNGYAALYLFPESPYLIYLMNGISISLILITGSLLIEELIPLDKRGFWRRSFVVIRAIGVFGILMTLAGGYRFVGEPLHLAGLYLAMSCVIVSVIGIFKRLPLARLYAATFMVYYLGGVLVVIRNLHLFNLPYPVVDHAFQVGTALHMVLIQIAIAMRFNRMERERKEASSKIEEEIIRSQKLESIALIGGGIAHDFNNMLTVIMSTVTLGKMYAGDNVKVIEKLEEAEREIIHARELTNQLLTFAKGGAPVKKVSSLQEMLRDTVEFSLKGSAVKSDFSVPEDLWYAEIDRTQISQVISNLVINAVQAMPGGGTIKVRARNELREGQGGDSIDGRCVVISIEDSGAGIPPENLGRIFDPFFTTKPKGSGLGLATCYSVVKRHNGFIDVRSEVGKGSMFSIYLPASAKAGAIEPVHTEGELAGKGRVLLMDDDESLLKNVAELLAGIGYEVESARNGEEAVILYKRAKYAARPFDAVVLDLTVVDGMGGRACLQEIMEMDLLVKAVVMSGYSDDTVFAHYRQHGFSAAVAKPFTIEELQAALLRVMAEKRGGDA